MLIVVIQQLFIVIIVICLFTINCVLYFHVPTKKKTKKQNYPSNKLTNRSPNMKKNKNIKMKTKFENEQNCGTLHASQIRRTHQKLSTISNPSHMQGPRFATIVARCSTAYTIRVWNAQVNENPHTKVPISSSLSVFLFFSIFLSLSLLFYSSSISLCLLFPLCLFEISAAVNALLRPC